MPQLQYRILGSFDVTRDGRALDLGGPKQRAVLAVLLLSANRPVSAGRLVDAVWGDDPPDKAEASLQAYVSNLRKVLEPDRPPRTASRVLTTEPGGYRLVAERDQVDALRVEDLVTAAQAQRRSGDLDGARATLRSALEQCGPLLPEMDGEPWLLDAAARLDALHANALETCFEVQLDLGLHHESVPELESAVAAHPLRERLRAQLALALYRSGRQTDALRGLSEARRVLVEEVGIEPGPELRRLEAQILGQAAELEHRPPVAPGGDTDTWSGPERRRSRPPAALPETAPADRPDEQRCSTGFVGRREELEALVDSLRGTIAGNGRAIVVSGEPGIGKTRLVEELVAEGRREGMGVAWARCPESAAQASFWACAQIGTQLLEDNAVDPHILRPLVPAEPPTGPVDPAADRLALDIGAVKALASATRPLLLVIDDLQWADPASLKMIEFAAGELRSMPVMLVVTVRPTTADSPPDLVACLAELARQPYAQRLELAGLPPDDVAAWLAARTDVRVPASVAAFVHERSAGNPFYVRELVELLLSEGRLDDVEAARSAGVPSAVQDVLRRRLSRLPAATQQLLPPAAAIGRTFDVDILARVADGSVGEVLDALDPALGAGLVEDDVSLPGRFRFSHALVAETLVEELSVARRARLHAAVTDAMEELRAADLDNHLAELAHHALAGALAGTAEKAVDYSTRAARRASHQLAFEDAADHWTRVLRALELARPGDRRARYDALVALGVAHLGADAVVPATAALLDASRVADALGDPEAMARAVAPLNLPTLWPATDYRKPDPVEVEALQRVADLYTEHDVLRVDVLGALATSCFYLGDFDWLDRITLEALEIARSCADPRAVVRAAIRRFSAIWIPHTFEERVALSEEMIEVAAAHELPAEWAFPGWFTRVLVRIEATTLRADDGAVDTARRLATLSGWPAHMTQWGFTEATYRMLRGEYDEAVRVAAQAADLYRRTRAVSADAIESIYATIRGLERGRLDEVLSLAEGNIGGSYGPVWTEAIIWGLVEDGRIDDARAMSGMVVQVPDPPFDFLWFGIVVCAAETRAALGDVAAARSLYDTLSPFAGHLSLSGSGGIPFGVTHHALALLADTLGDHDAARRHIADAVEVHEALGAVPWIARSLVVQARLLREVDPEGSAAAAARARALCDEHELVAVGRQLDRAGFPA